MSVLALVWLSLGGYLLVGAGVTWLSLLGGANRWNTDWFEGNRYHRSRPDTNVVRWNFWAWPTLVVAWILYGVGSGCAFVGKIPDVIERMTVKETDRW